MLYWAGVGGPREQIITHFCIFFSFGQGPLETTPFGRKKNKQNHCQHNKDLWPIAAKNLGRPFDITHGACIALQLSTKILGELKMSPFFGLFLMGSFAWLQYFH